MNKEQVLRPNVNSHLANQSDTDTDIEIIDFYRPVGNGKNLFVSNINLDMEVEVAFNVVQETLHKSFSRYGPIYEIQVFPSPSGILNAFKGDDETSKRTNHQLDGSSVSNIGKPSSDGDPGQMKVENYAAMSSFYAFVKFYSLICAKRAKSHLHMTSIIGVRPVKVSFASRKKIEKRDKLYLNKCYDLANYYLGFNGWTSNKLVLKRDDDSDMSTNRLEGSVSNCRFLCIVELTIPGHSLVTQGVSTVEENWDGTDPTSKSGALARCRKRSYQYALENAFSKVLIVMLANGKVHVEIDTTQADLLHRLESLQNLHLVTVNELEEEPQESSEDESAQPDPPTVDDDNVNILMELEAGLCD